MDIHNLHPAPFPFLRLYLRLRDLLHHHLPLLLLHLRFRGLRRFCLIRRHLRLHRLRRRFRLRGLHRFRLRGLRRHLRLRFLLPVA